MLVLIVQVGGLVTLVELNKKISAAACLAIRFEMYVVCYQSLVKVNEACG